MTCPKGGVMADFVSFSIEELNRLTAQYMLERAKGEKPLTWVRRTYPGWRPGLHFGVSVIVREFADARL
jgi:hypothetical protein